jgi:Fe-S oxidoreductase
VSNAEPRETIIPWGKMSTAYFAARGDVETNASFAAPAWACTGCYACRESCDHRNDVAGTLLDARDAFVREGVAPEAATRTLARFDAHDADTARAVDTLMHNATISSGKSRVAVLLGCTYARKLPDVARDAIAVATKLFGAIAVERECCGLPLLVAGDAQRFEERAARFQNRDVVVVDPGCAVALRRAGARVTLLVEHVAARMGELREGAAGERAVRYHDPCQLGRGLGVYDAPRTILTRVTGRAPLELHTSRERAPCSGGGGLLPLTMPETSRAIADGVVADHETLSKTDGGEELVTACASSVLRFRKSGARASDLVSWIARSLA